MKKLKLEDLEVSSFTTQGNQDELGTVFGRQMTELQSACGCDVSQVATNCDWHCTLAVGCYPSLYCSGAGLIITCRDGCMTNGNGAC